ncbi:MAG: transglutaminase-like domain-containing protein [Elusimicrobia bacterium]|nr:transglutaminase-like domain-containing protein [Elusimicrobiota bacterium]
MATAPSERELRSLVDLLDDEDASSLSLVRERILGLGDLAMPFLEEAHDRFGPRLRRRIDSLVGELRFRSLQDAVALLAAPAEPDLEEGAFLLARFGRPGLDAAPCRRWLDETAAEVKAGACAEPYPLLHRLNVRLFSELGFRGNTARYYDPANSFLDRVIETRLGLPITLSVVVLLLGRRLGLPLEGAGLPGHFMVRFPAARSVYFLDPFHQGRILTRAQCRQFLLRSGYAFREEYLKPAKSRDILARMMRNLLSVYQRGGDAESAQRLSVLVEILLTRGGRQIG